MNDDNNVVKLKDRNDILHFSGYVLFFFTLWVTYNIIVATLLHAWSAASLTILDAIMKLLLWVVMPMAYIHFIDRMNPFLYLKLQSHWQRGFVVTILISLLFLLNPLYQNLVLHKHILFPSGFGNWLNVIGLSGVTEEVTFRGFFFQKIAYWVGFWKGALISSLLFVCIHIPIWTITGEIFELHIVYTACYIFTFGMLLCIIFIKTQSLWSTILIHSLNDFFSLINFK